MAVLVPGGMAEAMKLAFDRVAGEICRPGSKARVAPWKINYGI